MSHRIASRWVLVLGGLTAIGPFTVDAYLPALPTIADDLHTSAHTVQLTLTACLAGLALGQLCVGPLSDRFGRRRPLLVGVTAYTAASLACALAPTIGVLIGLRLVQGFAGAAGVVIARATVRDLYEGVTAARFFSRLMLVAGMAPILAPVVGAGLLQLTSWRGVFVALTGLGLVLLAVVSVAFRETLSPERRHADGAAAAVRRMTKLLGDRVFLGYGMTSGLAFAAMFAYISGSPFVVQEVYGGSTTLFAAMFAINAAGLVTMGQLNARLLHRVVPRRLLIIGIAAQCAGGVSLLTVVLLDPPGGGGPGLVAVLPLLFVVVASLGLALPNSTALALERHPNSAGSASALLGTLQFVVGAAAAPLVGGESSAVPLGVVIAVMSTSALTVLLVLTRPRPARLSGGR